MRGLALVALPILLVACQTDVRQAPVLAPKDIETADQAKPFVLKSIEFAIRRGQDVGGYTFSLTCTPSVQRVTWDRGRFAGNTEWYDRFFEELSGLGYPAVGDPARPFERERDSARAVYQVSAQVTAAEFSICDQASFWTGASLGYSGKAWVKVRWQVLSAITRRVVLETETEGTATVDQPSRDGFVVMGQEAFAAATRNLAGLEQFHAIASGAGDTKIAEPKPDVSSIAIPALPEVRGPIQGRMLQSRAAVPTIDLGGGHGSGFFITEDGYLLTNDHVVGARRQVTVRLPNGTELIGEVIRTDPIRDIALVKVAVTRTAALPLRRKPVEVGEDVYAIGAPMLTQLAQTVTRGIVSAIRIEPIVNGGTEALTMIQSDVVIQGGNSGGPLLDASGNVVAVCVSGIGKLNTGLNFFIPIGEALERLGIRIGPAGPNVTH